MIRSLEKKVGSLLDRILIMVGGKKIWTTRWSIKFCVAQIAVLVHIAVPLSLLTWFFLFLFSLFNVLILYFYFYFFAFNNISFRFCI